MFCTVNCFSFYKSFIMVYTIVNNHRRVARVFKFSQNFCKNINKNNLSLLKYYYMVKIIVKYYGFKLSTNS